MSTFMALNATVGHGKSLRQEMSNEERRSKRRREV